MFELKRVFWCRINVEILVLSGEIRSVNVGLMVLIFSCVQDLERVVFLSELFYLIRECCDIFRNFHVFIKFYFIS